MDDELYHRACKAYVRGGADWPVPSYGMSEVTWGKEGVAVVTLANVNGVLAQYRYSKATDRLRHAG